MEIVKQIKEICIETDNEWFLTHEFPQIALSDLQSEKYYTKSKWIISHKIQGKIPGFILIKCEEDNLCGTLFTHELVFACVRPEYRKKGILKNMINNLQKDWNVWLEASSNEIVNVENIWEKCGFRYHGTIHGHIIYKKLSSIC